VLTIGAPTSRVPRESLHDLAHELVAAADTLSRALGYAPED